jgi:hypothetical protein
VVSEKKIFLEIDQSETTIACGGHVCLRIGTATQAQPTEPLVLLHICYQLQIVFVANLDI